jgi:methylenetetrahydrofolate dehydrogenase (NADP+)/methenyltetrahydrofolate cyclohydrolase
MTAQILDGKGLAATVRARVAAEVRQRFSGRPPSLHVVLVGDDPASAVYVRNKERAAQEAGIAGAIHRLPAAAPEAEILELVERLAADDTIDGILVQLPLPAHVQSARILAAIPARKDVDGFHPENAGRLFRGEPLSEVLVPCTPLGCMHLLGLSGVVPRGKRAVVIGRSAIVGRPMAMLLLAADATVTIAHSRTENLAAVCQEADILVAAVGRPEFVRGSWIKPGAVVLDVGINRVSGVDGVAKLVGDVHFAEASAVAGWITPVPGGVGPMTIACLLENTLLARSFADAR